MKKVISLVVVLSMFMVFGCSKTSEESNDSEDLAEKTVITVVVPKSPASIPILRMADSNALGENVELDIQIYTDMDKMMAFASNGEYDYMEIPVNTAAVLYNKGLNVKLMNVLLWGGISFVATDDNCNGFKDIKGEKLYVPAKGSVPDMITQYFLEKNGLDIGKDVEIIYSNHTEIAQLIKSGVAKYAVDVEPFITMNKENIENYKVIMDFSQEWKKIQGNEYKMPNFGFISREEFLKDNGQDAKKFNEELQKAIIYLSENNEEAGELAEKYLNSNSDVIERSFSKFNFNYNSSYDAKDNIKEYFKVLENMKPESIGGKIPDENFYYKGE